MATTRSRSLLTIACAVLATAVTTVTFSVSRVAAACTAIYRFACDFVASVPAKFKEARLPTVARPVELVQACAYALGLAKRERPHVRSQWRMCPSV